MGKLTDRVAIVTGGGNGIGKAISLALAGEGADIVIPDLDTSSARQVADEIERLGRKCLVIQADVSSADEVDRIFDFTVKTFGQVDIVLNNAGFNHPRMSILDLDLKHLDQIIGLDYKGVYFCCRRAGMEMKKRNKGCIINISSVVGILPSPDVIYSSMKSAVNMLTRVLARDFARFGVRVNAICPGFTRVQRIQEAIDQGLSDPSSFLQYTPMHEFVEPEDIGHMAFFLAPDEARHITGSLFVADAGISAQGAWPAYPAY